MRVTALNEQKRNPDRVNVHVDGRFRCGAARELVARLGLRVGEEVTQAELERLVEGDVAYQARDAALRLLAHRARSEAELRDRLLRKGYAPPEVGRVLEALAEQGYLDDAAFAESWVRERVRLRPKGRPALLAELRGKGVAEATARQAIEAVLVAESVDERALARDAAEAWARRSLRGRAPADREARLKLRRRLYAHLARRGFRGEVARAAVAEVLGG